MATSVEEGEVSASGDADAAAADSTVDLVVAELARPLSVPSGLVHEVGARLPEARAALAAEASLLLVPGAMVDGRFVVERFLGRGGMGVVYAARNLRTDKSVALKCMALREGALPERRAQVASRFRREARVVASIRHPNVVEVYDAGESDGAPYLVMELLEGESLRARLERGALAWPEARTVFLAVLAGVAAAHRAGVVHRDLKPDNIFLARAHGSSEVIPKVLDFGIAAVRDADTQEGSLLTRTGAVLGTPSYMAPEQLTAGKIDARTDVYALGVVLYELLSGQLPFKAPSAGALAVLQATESPVPLSRHRPELRGRIEALVMRALARQPAQRYATVDAFAQAIEGEATSRRSRMISVALFGGVMLLVLVTLWLHRTNSPGAAPRQQVNLPVKVTPSLTKLEVAAPPAVVDAGPAPSASERSVSQPAPALKPARTARPRVARPAPAPKPTELRAEEF